MTAPSRGTVDAPSRIEWRRLDARMLLIHPVVEVGRALPALFALVFAGSGSGHGSRWGLIGTGLVLIGAILRWFTTRYRITDQQIQLRHGLFRRRTVVAPLDRVRTVDVTAHALHRVLGLARVVIGTGTSDRRNGRPALTLDGLGLAQATRLRAELLHRTPVLDGGPASAAEETELLRLDRRWLWYAPFTLSGAVTALAIAGFAWRVQNETQTDVSRIGPLHDAVAQLRALPLWLSAVEVAGSAIVFIALASTVGYMLAFWNFRLSRHTGGSVHVTRGLLTARATSVEERRLRGVELSEPLLLRAVGGARTLAIATGLRVGRGAERGGTMLMPPGPRAEAERVAAAIVGPGAVCAALHDHGPIARRRRVTRALTGSVLLVATVGAASWLSGSSWWWWASAVLLLPLGGVLAADRARSLGHTLVDGYLVTRYGSLVRRRSAVATGAIIGWNIRSSVFQRRAGLVTLTATTAAGRQGYRVPDLPEVDAVALADAATPGLLAGLRG